MSDIPEPDRHDEPTAEQVALFPLVYANVLTIHANPFDVMLDFAARQPEAPPGPVSHHEIGVRIATSWGQLKAMIPLLTRVVADYEEIHGVIPSPGFEQDARS